MKGMFMVAGSSSIVLRVCSVWFLVLLSSPLHAADTPPTPVGGKGSATLKVKPEASPAPEGKGKDAEEEEDDESGAGGATDDSLDGRSKQLQDYAAALRNACSAKDKPTADRRKANVQLSKGQTSFDKSVCEVLCVPGAKVPLCSLADDPTAARAVALAAWSDVLAIRDHVSLIRDESGSEKTLPPSMKGLTLGGSTVTGVSPSDVVTESAVRILQGLAKMIADRAKAESVSWVLDEIGTNLCPNASANFPAPAKAGPDLVKAEIARYWLPSLCALASSKRLGGYGSGAALLAQLKAAVTLDLEGWPGAAAGLIPAELYWEDGRTLPHGTWLPACRADDLTAEQKDFCSAVDRIRGDTQRIVTEIVGGRNPLDALDELARSYDAENTRPSVDGKTGLRSPRVQMLACSMAAPLRFHADFDADTSANKERAATAAGLSALVGPAPCWNFVGWGYALPNGSAVWEPGKLTSPLHAKTPIERISTIVRLKARVFAHVRSLLERGKAVQEAYASFLTARDALNAAVKELAKAKAPDSEKSDPESGENAADVVDAHAAATARAVVGPAEQATIAALLKLGGATTRLGEAFVDTTASLAEEGLLGSNPKGKPKLAEQLRKVRRSLAEVAKGIEFAQSLIARDWTKMAAQTLQMLSARVSASAAPRVESRLFRHISVLTAIASARDSNGVASVLDGAAEPLGGWRGKGEGDAFTVSLMAQAGFYVAHEWRYGTYGAYREKGGGHFQAPTLALPVGVELAWADCFIGSPFALFFSGIDPAAFLAYDAEKDARLPGASIKTALAPGAGLRFGIPTTPFSVVPYFAYRPGFRQWNSNLSGTGADALQLGLLLGVDVTLLVLHRSGGSN